MHPQFQIHSTPLGKVTLRPYQRDCVSSIEQSTARRKAVVMPTGGGKTFVFASYALQNPTQDAGRCTPHRTDTPNPRHFSIIRPVC